MAQVLSRTEFRGLCLEMNVNPDEPPETTLTGQCSWLIHFLQSDGRLPKLLALLKWERPHIDWQRPSVPTGRDMRNRLNVLQNIQATWIEGFLHQSLAQAVTLELDLSHEPTAVARKILTAPGQSEMPVEDVREVFEAYGRALLILGDPGSGKTITLLQLAETLIVEAQHDPSQPIPVVLNLASWAQAQKPLTEWLVEEIFIQYQMNCFSLFTPGALRSVAHHDDQSRPLVFAKLIHGLQDTAVNSPSVRFTQTHNENPLVVLVSLLGKSFIGRNEQTPLPLHYLPEQNILQAFICRAANIFYLMPHLLQGLNCYNRNVFVYPDFHAGSESGSRNVICSSAREAAYSKQARISSRSKDG